MKKLNAFLVSVLSVAALNAAVIEQVIVRQQWPWSTDVKIEYKISAVTNPVDIAIQAYNGATELLLPEVAITGERYGITEDGVGTFVIDPVAAFGTEKVALANFKVKLTVSDSSENINETLYRIYSLTNSNEAVVNVTRRDLLNGKYGTIETDYAAIIPGFEKEIDQDDVLIWTGVTNSLAYKTTHLVMRKIPAAGKVWRCGDLEGAVNNRAALRDRYYLKLTQDYFIGVFELTQAQYRNIYGSNPSTFTGDPDADIHPAEGFMRYDFHGNPNPTGNKGVITGETICWPTNSYLHDVGAGTVLAILRQKTGVEFDMPTGAQWEFACRAGVEAIIYSGKDQSTANLTDLGWISTAATGAKTHAVGLKSANEFGLYDMYGNVAEYVQNAGTMNLGGATEATGATADDPIIDPLGSSDGQAIYKGEKNRSYRGGSWNDRFGTWHDCRSAAFLASFKWSQEDGKAYIGARVVCPVGAQWSAH